MSRCETARPAPSVRAASAVSNARQARAMRLPVRRSRGEALSLLGIRSHEGDALHSPACTAPSSHTPRPTSSSSESSARTTTKSPERAGRAVDGGKEGAHRRSLRRDRGLVRGARPGTRTFATRAARRARRRRSRGTARQDPDRAPVALRERRPSRTGTPLGVSSDRDMVRFTGSEASRQPSR